VYAELLFEATQQMTEFLNIYFRKLQMKNSVVLHSTKPSIRGMATAQGHAFAPRDSKLAI